MNEDCRWLGTPVVRVRILAGVLVLLAAGCLVLGRSSRTTHVAAKVAEDVPAFHLTAAEAVSADGVSPIGAKARLQSHAQSLFAGLPLMFEPNVGQGNPTGGSLDVNDPQVKFIARGSNYSLFLGSQGATLNLNVPKSAKMSGSRSGKKDNVIESLQMKLAGANPNAPVTAAEALPGKSNYLLGNDPSKWKIGVPQFARVRYENVYPGINLVFYGNQGHLEYDFQVAPGADPNRAELQFDGAQRVSLNDGALMITGPSGAVRFEAPHVYQKIAGQQQPVEGKFVLRGHRVRFAIGNYDHSRELVIDPVLTFSTYFGGAGNELNNYVAIDQSFNIYLAGSTTSSPPPSGTFPVTTGVVQTTLNGPQNVYIAKIIPPLGSTPAVLDYVTYLGGNGIDYPVGIGVDGAQNPYVAGTTSSTNFPVSANNPYQSGATPGSPGPHVFVTRLTASASALTYSSYLSGSGTDIASGMTTDGQGFIYVTGSTTSTNPSDYAPGVQWPVISLPNGQPFQPTPKAAAGVVQFFVSKVNTQGFGSASITYSTYFGGGSFETSTPTATGGGITVDTTGNIYFSGTTNFTYTGTNSLTDFPILNAYQPCLDQPAPAVVVNPPTCTPASTDTATDAFVAKLNPNAPAGTGQLGWSTYIGGSSTDSSTGVAVDPNGAANVYVVGTTNSPDIASSQLTSTTTTAFQRCLDQPTNPAVGQNCSPPAPPAPTDAFVAKFPNLVASTTTFSNLQLTYFSFLGGSANDEGLAIAVDTASGALLTGWTQSPDFLVFGAANIQGTTLQGTQDAFIARLNTAATVQGTSGAGSWTSIFGGSTTSSGGSASTEGTSVAVDVNQNVYFAGDTTSVNLPVEKPVQGSNAGGSDAFVAELGNASTVTITGLLTIANSQSYVSSGNQATFTYTITNGGPDPAYNLSVTDSLVNAQTGSVTVAFNSASATTGTCSSGSSTSVNVICTIPSLQAGSTATVTIVVTPTATSSGGGGTRQFTGGTVQVLSASNILLAETSVTANLSDYSMSISPNNQSVVAGNTGSYQVTITPVPLYSSNISLSCSGVPAAAACNFTNNPVTLPGASPGSSTLNITTTVRPINTTSNSLLRHFYALWLMVPGIGLIGVRSRDRRRRRIAGLLMLLTVFSLLVLLPACSHGTVQPPVSGTPAGTYTINVTATSGTDTKTQSIILNVS